MVVGHKSRRSATLIHNIHSIGMNVKRFMCSSNDWDYKALCASICVTIAKVVSSK